MISKANVVLDQFLCCCLSSFLSEKKSLNINILNILGYTYSNCRPERIINKMDCSYCHKNLSMSFRSVDGSCNNLENPSWGASQTSLQRIIGEYLTKIKNLINRLYFVL